MAVRPNDCLSCSRICVILDAGDQRRRCQRQDDSQSWKKDNGAESKGVGKDSRSTLCEVAVVRGIGIIACMGQKHVRVLGSWSSLWCVRVVASVLGYFQFSFLFV